MNREGIRVAIKEAERFLNTATDFEKLVHSQRNDTYSSSNPKESGAVRRASMDLTRALANMRKAN